MALWNLIPTCPDPMSCYTLVGFAIVCSGNIGAFVVLVRWMVREFKRIDIAITDHDDCIDNATEIINRMSTDIAVTRESVQNIETAVTETKTSINGINQTLLRK